MAQRAYTIEDMTARVHKALRAHGVKQKKLPIIRNLFQAVLELSLHGVPLEKIAEAIERTPQHVRSLRSQARRRLGQEQVLKRTREVGEERKVAIEKKKREPKLMSDEEFRAEIDRIYEVVKDWPREPMGSRYRQAGASSPPRVLSGYPLCESSKVRQCLGSTPKSLAALMNRSGLGLPCATSSRVTTRSNRSNKPDF